MSYLSILNKSGHLFWLIVPLICASVSPAQESQPATLTDKTVEVLQKLKPLQESKDYDGMLGLVNSLIPSVGPTSYDLATLLDMKGKLHLQKNDYRGAIDPLYQSLALSDKYNYFDAKATLDNVDILAHIYYAEASTSKDSATQQDYIAKAATLMKRWIQTTPKSNSESMLFYATILYSQSTSNPSNIDKTLLAEAKKEVERGLLGSTKPKEGFYLIYLAVLQQEGEISRSAEILELLVKQYPSNKVYWQQLLSTYLNLANEKDEKIRRENYTRAINTFERAQALGLMNTPKDNYNLVTIYFTVNQFGKATELLYSGLKNGAIESDLKNWFLLSYSYQQVNQEKDAIRVLTEARQIFPKSGQIEFQLGQIYSQLEKTKDANTHYKAAVLKGELDKPHLAYMFYAYTSFELEQFDDALKAAEKASEYPEAAKDSQLPKLKAAILESIKERAQAKLAIESK